jgi:hypothetical protein
MAELRRYALLAALLLAACAKPSAKAPPAEILCAAEALNLARSADSPVDEDMLRERSDLFRRKLPPAELERFRRQVDQLADARGTQPLIASATCEGLLTPDDHRELATSAAQEASVHDKAIGNSR